MMFLRRLGVTWADSFTRANQSGLGNGWTLGSGSTQPALSSNTAACTSATAGYYPAIYPQQVRTDRYYVQAKLAGAPSAVAVALLTRCNTAFTQQVGVFISSSSDTQILLVQTATGSTATTEATSSTTWSSGQYVTLTAAGNVYTVWKSTTPAWQSGGTNVLSWTDSGAATSTGLGYRYGGIGVQYDGTNLSAPLQNFVMSDY